MGGSDIHMDVTSITSNWQVIAAAAAFGLIWLGVFVVVMRRSISAPARRRVDLRFYNRYRSRFKGWLDLSGQKRGIRGIDLNNSGALVTSKAPAPPGSVVFLYIKSHGLMGWGKVKHCSRSGLKYRIGLEFRGSLLRAREGDWNFSTVRHKDTSPESRFSESVVGDWPPTALK